MMSLVTLMPVNFWIKERINQEAMIPIRPIIAEVRVEPAAATAFSSPPLVKYLKPPEMNIKRKIRPAKKTTNWRIL